MVDILQSPPTASAAAKHMLSDDGGKPQKRKDETTWNLMKSKFT